MSCRPCADTTLIPGNPAMGVSTTPSRRTIRIVPALSVTRKFPSGKKAIDQGEFRRAVIVSTFTGAEGFAGGGASVWPAKAGLGFGPCQAKGDWARAGGNSKIATTDTMHANAFMKAMI